MELINNIENKAKFFALYWGQKILRCTATDGCGLEPFEVRLNERSLIFDYLQLTPLSQITDEDEKQLIKILYPNDDLVIEKLSSNKVGAKLEFKLTASQKWLMPKNKQSVIIFNNLSFNHEFANHIYLKAADYLRSKGYALPWMGLSVEQLGFFGWVKLKEANQ